MKKLLISLLFVVSTLLSSPAKSADERIDFIFDLDHVLLFHRIVKEQTPANLIHPYGGYNYRTAEHLVQFFNSLREIPNARISFFSFGSDERNETVLKSIKIDAHTSLFDLAEGRVFGVGKASELTEAGKPLGKELSIVVEDLNLERAFLIDDTVANARPGQERNLVKVIDFSHHFGRKFPERSMVFEKRTLQQYARRMWGELARVRALIDEALILSEEKGISPVEAMSKIQWKEGSYKITSRSIWTEKYYQRGMRLLNIPVVGDCLLSARSFH